MKNMVHLLDAPKLREKSSPIWALKSSQYWGHQKHPFWTTLVNFESIFEISEINVAV